MRPVRLCARVWSAVSPWGYFPARGNRCIRTYEPAMDQSSLNPCRFGQFVVEHGQDAAPQYADAASIFFEEVALEVTNAAPP